MNWKCVGNVGSFDKVSLILPNLLHASSDERTRSAIDAAIIADSEFHESIVKCVVCASPTSETTGLWLTVRIGHLPPHNTTYRHKSEELPEIDILIKIQKDRHSTYFFWQRN